MNDRSQPTAIFVADSHFHLGPDPAETRRVERFVELLEYARHADHIILLGDIFDFWFDYPNFRLKGYEEILAGLDRLADTGTRIHFVGGNHDIWAADYLHRRYGSAPGGGPLTLTLGSLRVRLVHGDGLLGRDWAYAAFRAVVRNRPAIALAKTLHPEILFRLSTWLSGQSRAATREEAQAIERKAGRWLQAQRSPAWDLMVIGHVHHPLLTSGNGRSFACLGGWLDRLGYGVLQDGEFRLLDFERDPRPDIRPRERSYRPHSSRGAAD
jgi:UDP-2,3-diacylglucosamine hydrolase